MKLFFTRTINILLVVVVLLVYQLQATARAQEISDYNEEKAEYEALLAQQSADSGAYADGVYTGSAMGFSGDITVQVTVEGGAVTAVELTDSSDDAEYLDKAKSLLDDLVTNQGADGLDAVSGATFSSNGILDAFRNAMEGGTA